jgi:hypothetical protein
MRSCLRSLFLAGLFSCAAGAAQAEAPKIYDGMTQAELVAFAKRQGWEAEPWAGHRDVLLRVKAAGVAAGGPVIVHLTHCDTAGRCRSGLLRSMSYHFIENRDFLTHWNLANLGATGFSERYVTLQRYLHFRGVTDTYLQEVIGEMWAGAAARFWADVEKVATQERRR